MCDRPSVWRQSDVRARKAYRCCECGDDIAVGVRYRSMFGVWEGDACTFRACLPCAELYEDATKGGECLPLGDLSEWVFDRASVGGLGDEVGEADDFAGAEEGGEPAFIARHEYAYAPGAFVRAVRTAEAATHASSRGFWERQAAYQARRWRLAADALERPAGDEVFAAKVAAVSARMTVKAVVV